MRISVPPFHSPVFSALLLALTLPIVAHTAQAQSLGYEGPTGVFVTPLASTAASPANGLGKPSVSYHFLAGGPVIGDFSTVSVTEGFAKRFEVGYTSEIHNEDGVSGLAANWDSGLSIVHAKANLIPDSFLKQKWIPAISVGGILRTNDQIGLHLNVVVASLLDAYPVEQKTANGDVYVVATKVITQVSKKVPILLNIGLRGTNASLWGLGGNSPGFEGKVFGAAAFVITGPAKSTIILGSEVAEQPQHILSATAGAHTALFDIPTSEVYAVRLVPFAKLAKLNVDAGVLHAGGWIGNGTTEAVMGSNLNLNMRARVAFAVSYGF
jgi:hypothetical protein